ncbi:hypothetical protein ACFLXC_03160 [Chloroflexota bacterium]
MKRVVIPDSEKARGIVWVEYPACRWEEWWARWAPKYIAEEWQPECVVELKINAEKN